MKLAASKLERLKFLTRVVKKEIQHLKYSADKVFSKPFTVAIAKQLDGNEQLAEQVEAFSSRFCRLQDTIGDKLLPAWLDALGEKTSVAVDNLDKAEKLGVLSCAELWLELRQLRNQMIHEYIEDMTILVNALDTAHKRLGFIVGVAEAIINNIEERKLCSR